MVAGIELSPSSQRWIAFIAVELGLDKRVSSENTNQFSYFKAEEFTTTSYKTWRKWRQWEKCIPSSPAKVNFKAFSHEFQWNLNNTPLWEIFFLLFPRLLKNVALLKDCSSFSASGESVLSLLILQESGIVRQNISPFFVCLCTSLLYCLSTWIIFPDGATKWS